jgi:hypothetical protein
MDDILRWAASVGTIGAGLIRLPGCGLDLRRLSNRGICADGAKHGGDAHQPVRHLSMADLEGKGMKKPGARRSADPPLWVIAYRYPKRSAWLARKCLSQR